MMFSKPVRNTAVSRWIHRAAMPMLLLALMSQAQGQALEWGAAKYFQYNIENVVVTAPVPGTWDINVIFSVGNPITGALWDIKNDQPFSSPGANLTLDIGWDPASDFTNTGSVSPALTSISTTALGTGAAIPVQVRNLNRLPGASACGSSLDCPGVASTANRYRIARTVQAVAFVKPLAVGRVALEGRPVCNGVPGYVCMDPVNGAFVNIPVRSAVANFRFAPSSATTALVTDPRRPVVDIRKCQSCHDGNRHGDTTVPRLSLHGANRNENLGLCVVCHNPNQTDVPYRYLTAGTAADPRIGGAETPIDFKTMVHSIHAGGFRKTPFVVVGFNSSVNDFSGVRFPAQLRNCTSCHVEVNGKGTFELPLKPTVLGTTVTTQSTYQVALGAARTISVNPSDDLKISPTAAVCSSCHDKAEVKTHMIRTGRASFSTTQASIGTTVKERCANCHGPGKEEDVRRAHEIGRGGRDDD
jgi:OmcA/MtrC family decaheme c-type cytochrome